MRKATFKKIKQKNGCGGGSRTHGANHDERMQKHSMGPRTRHRGAHSRPRAELSEPVSPALRSSRPSARAPARRSRQPRHARRSCLLARGHDERCLCVRHPVECFAWVATASPNDIDKIHPAPSKNKKCVVRKRRRMRDIDEIYVTSVDGVAVLARSRRVTPPCVGSMRMSARRVSPCKETYESYFVRKTADNARARGWARLSCAWGGTHKRARAFSPGAGQKKRYRLHIRVSKRSRAPPTTNNHFVLEPN